MLQKTVVSTRTIFFLGDPLGWQDSKGEVASSSSSSFVFVFFWGGGGLSPDDFDDCKRAQDKPTSLLGKIRVVWVFFKRHYKITT